MIDYIVVGSGLAGMSFCHTLQKNNRTFLLYDNGTQQASTVAAGVYNPVILKRFNAVWNAMQYLNTALPFYEQMEEDLGVKIHDKIAVRRKFASVHEQNLWFEASDKKEIQPFLSKTLVKNTYAHIYAPFSFGKVVYSGRIDVALMQDEFKRKLHQQGLIVEETFDYTVLEHSKTILKYKGIPAKNIVFCEGTGSLENPLFNYLPLQGIKGELITIVSPLLKLKEIIKSSVFIIPVGNDHYKVGATYAQDDSTNIITRKARVELTTKVKTTVKCPFQVVCQETGIRPVVIDRKPMVGTHPEYNNIHIINGLGSRGVLIAPFIAAQLYYHIEQQIPVSEKINIKRFEATHFPYRAKGNSS